ncbi:hypothetical protein AAFC00_007059 [Neodothiora populina]|uniref:Uncharacterized protein n=1 Tax=Neodothiora populina TaxID=2781224 RepID=A0ABR3PC18_9PEZI
MDPTTPNRPRTTSRVSAWSHKSDKSNGSKPKATGPSESPADKKRRDSFWKGGSKANPNAAMNEVQPGDAAVLEKATIESLRKVQHKDRDGNIIADPDLSNPTRSRWERPLDTIRSFDKNIEAGYKRRSLSRSESYDPREQYASRRSSYIGGHDQRYQSAAPSVSQYNGGYYGQQRRPDGFQDDGTSPIAPPSRNRYNQRMGTMTRSQSSYGPASPPHGYNGHDAYEAGVASDSTGQWNYSTDPSSENSSIDRAHAAAAAAAGMKGNSPDGFAYNDGFANGAPIMEEYDSGSDGYGMSHHPRNGGPPPAPMHSQAPAVRAPIKLGGEAPISSQGGSLPSMARKAPEKEEKKEKKGFFKKRFSKSS